MWTAFVIGILGSLHCVGMCGPIALAIPVNGNGLAGKIRGGLSYNIGRITTYTIGGIMFGLLGEGLVIAGWQRTLTIAVGASMILFVLIPYLFKSKRKSGSRTSKWVGKLKTGMGAFLKKKSLSGIFTLGLLNGLLPCGLVYLAIAGAIATGGALDGGLYMLLFGLGTIPSMFSMYFLGHSMSITWRNRIRAYVPVFAILLGSLFILRGLNLGIPYLSPEMSSEKPEVHNCCHAPESES